MSLILRNYISIQRTICLHKLASQRPINTPSLCNISNIKKLTGIIQVKYAHTENNDETNNTHIYSGKLAKPLRLLKAFSLTTTCLTLTCQPIVFMKMMEDSTQMPLAIFVSLSIYTICTPLILQYIIGKKYIVNMYYNSNEDKYIAETCSMFLRRKRVEFTEDDVRAPDVSGPFTTCYVKGKPIFFNESGFSDEEYYHRIMGHYKPVDFHLNHNVEKIDTLPDEHKKQNQ